MSEASNDCGKLSAEGTDTITVLEGFDAMRVFLDVIWQRQDRTSHEIAFVLGGSRWVDGSPADPTIWEDWLVAIRMSRRRAQGEHDIVNHYA
jgi:hypothetical protein